MQSKSDKRALARCRVYGVRWISRALAGEWVQLIRIETRILVYYCRTLVRELDLLHQRSTALDRWWI